RTGGWSIVGTRCSVARGIARHFPGLLDRTDAARAISEGGLEAGDRRAEPARSESTGEETTRRGRRAGVGLHDGHRPRSSRRATRSAAQGRGSRKESAPRPASVTSRRHPTAPQPHVATHEARASERPQFTGERRPWTLARIVLRGPLASNVNATIL